MPQSLGQFRFSLAFLCVLTLALVSARAQPAPAQTVPAQAGNAQPDVPAESLVLASRLQLKQSPGTAHLVLDLSTSVPFRAFLHDKPDRLVIELPETRFLTKDPRLAPHAGLIKAMHSGLFDKDHARIVLDLAQPVKILNATLQPNPDNTARLVLDLARTDRASFTASLTPDSPQSAAPVAAPAPDATPSLALRGAPDMPGQGAFTAPAPAPPASPPANANPALNSGPAPAMGTAPNSGALPLVVLDPGHGGPDAGATGLGGILEKDTVFAFAASVKARLEGSHRYRVILTRDQDVFVPLAERMRIARAANADLFLSLHADTLSAAQSVAGATVYTVSDRASDAEAARIAAHENAADQAGGLIVSTQPPEVADILTDLTRRETRAYAHVFSRSLVNAWKSGPFLALNKNPQRSAGFVVLKAPDVPSVLLELGYLSSPADAKSLTSDQWRDSASTAVLKSIDAFFTNRSLLKKVEDDGPAIDQMPTATIRPAEPK